MSPYSRCLIVGAGCGVVTLAAYMARVYAEFGKILSREVKRISTRGKSC
jgi:tRNA A58 N-methylase Trm61